MARPVIPAAAATDGRSADAAIGLEVHVQLATGRKLFCADAAAPGEPNAHVCPVCLGLPGALPVLDPNAVERALRAALGLGCTVHERSVFERKSYFYPDLPKGYQITQQEQPLATGGRLEFRSGGRDLSVRLRRVHLEEDAGRLLHDRFDGRTAIDLNRAGVPLIEIVTEPELRRADDARAFLLRLRQTLRYLGVSECDMENGTLRVDANVSLGAAAGAGAGRVEIKNLNSFAHVEAALRHELERQAGERTAGREVAAETRSWDAARGVTRVLRAKEGTDDYRYLIDPDLPPLTLDTALIGRIRAALPELPAARERRFATAYDLPVHDVEVITADAAVADYFEALARASGDPRESAKWLLGPVMAWLNRTGSSLADAAVAPQRVADVLRLVAEGRVSRSAARRLFDEMAATGQDAAVLLERTGLAVVSDEARIRRWIEQVLARYPDEAARLRTGERKLIGFFMGRIMKQSGGAADPVRTAQLLEEQLDA